MQSATRDGDSTPVDARYAKLARTHLVGMSPVQLAHLTLQQWVLVQHRALLVVSLQPPLISYLGTVTAYPGFVALH
jgi:hypothetical protein